MLIPRLVGKFFMETSLRKNGFLPQPEPMRTLSRVPLEHSWDGRKGWDYEVALGGEVDADFVTIRGWVSFHSNVCCLVV